LEPARTTYVGHRRIGPAASALPYDGAVSIRCHVAVRDPDDGSVLVLADGALPSVHLDDALTWQLVSPIVAAMRERHGLDVVVLRACWLADEGSVSEAGSRLYEAESAGRATPTGAAWVDVEAIYSDDPGLAAAIVGGALTPAAGDHQPWYRLGWFARMGEWIDGCLDEAGLRRRGPIRQARSWGRSALVTLDTDRGRVWAKQVPEVFAHEIAVTGLLEDCDPGLVPPLLAADPAGGRLLIEHVDGDHLSDGRAEPAAWAATMARLAEIQRVLAADLEALRVAGVPAAPLDALADRAPDLLADEDLLLVGRPGGLTRREHRAVLARTTEVVQACRRLADSPIGPSLDHGDLSPGQVIVGAMGPVILDWSDATVTHPFIAAASFLMDADALPTAKPRPDAAALAGAYLEGWASRGDETGPRGLRDDLELARIVHPVHMAWLYATRVLPGLEQPWEMDRMVPRFIRAGILAR
jgi:hypothetical protein